MRTFGQCTLANQYVTHVTHVTESCGMSRQPPVGAPEIFLMRGPHEEQINAAWRAIIGLEEEEEEEEKKKKKKKKKKKEKRREEQ